MSRTKENLILNSDKHITGEGAGLKKNRIRCCFCNHIIDDGQKACSCGCQVFTCPAYDEGYVYCWKRTGLHQKSISK